MLLDEALMFDSVMSEWVEPVLLPVHVKLRDFGAVPSSEVVVRAHIQGTGPGTGRRVAGAFEFDLMTQATTVNGECVLNLYPSSLLKAAGYSGWYKLDSLSRSPRAMIWVPDTVPDGGGHAVDMVGDGLTPPL